MTQLEVGRIVRPHGLRGEVIVELVTNRQERLAPGTLLDSDAGRLEVVRSSPHANRWIVQFSRCESRDAAERLRGLALRAEPLDDGSGVLWVHELIGSVVVLDGGGEVGRVVAVEANPASDLLVLDGGHLIPLRFVVAFEAGRVVVSVPEGLLEL